MKKMKKTVASIVTMLMLSSNSSFPMAETQAEALVMPTVNTELTREDFVKNVRDSLNNPSYEAFTEKSKTTNLGYYNWCAAYVSYYLGNDVTGANNYNRDVDSIVDAYVTAGRYYEADGNFTPMVGDLVVYDENGDRSDGCEHIGVVSGVNSETGDITTIEGNAYRWRSHNSNLNPNEKLDWDCMETYELRFTAEEVYDIESKLGEQGFSYNGDGYSIKANACWDYYYDSSKSVNSCEKRTVTEFEAKDVKTLFIAGYCVPNFKEPVKAAEKEHVEEKNVEKAHSEEKQSEEKRSEEGQSKEKYSEEKQSEEKHVKAKIIEERHVEKIAEAIIEVVKGAIVSNDNLTVRLVERGYPRGGALSNFGTFPNVDFNNDGCVSVADVVWYYKNIVN